MEDKGRGGNMGRAVLASCLPRAMASCPYNCMYRHACSAQDALARHLSVRSAGQANAGADQCRRIDKTRERETMHIEHACTRTRFVRQIDVSRPSQAWNR